MNDSKWTDATERYPLKKNSSVTSIKNYVCKINEENKMCYVHLELTFKVTLQNKKNVVYGLPTADGAKLLNIQSLTAKEPTSNGFMIDGNTTHITATNADYIIDGYYSIV